MKLVMKFTRLIGTMFGKMTILVLLKHFSLKGFESNFLIGGFLPIKIGWFFLIKINTLTIFHSNVSFVIFKFINMLLLLSRMSNKKKAKLSTKISHFIFEFISIFQLYTKYLLIIVHINTKLLNYTNEITICVIIITKRVDILVSSSLTL